MFDLFLGRSLFVLAVEDMVASVVMHVGATEFFVGIDVPFGIVVRGIQAVGDFAALDFAVPHIPSVPSADIGDGNDFGSGDDIEVGSLIIDIAVVDFGHLFDEFVIN